MFTIVNIKLDLHHSFLIESSDIIFWSFIGENYSYWSYVMKKKLKGKRMWSYVDETSVKLTDKKDEVTKELETQDVSNSKILTWINDFVS